MRIHVTKERAPGERRVALVPETVAKLTAAGATVAVEAGAGAEAGFSDDEYAAAGASIASAGSAGEHRGAGPDSGDGALVVVAVRPPDDAALATFDADTTLISLLDPLGSPDRVRALAQTGATAFALEMVPRVTRAQAMDVLSSQASLAGYIAVLEAAVRLPKIFPMMMTAAGTLAPARVLVIGAGVAGLQAIATARRLGAVVRAFDIRPEVKEQVESLGAQFVGLALQEAVGGGGYAKEVSEDVHRQEQELLSKQVAQSDVVITTAAVPGRRAPVLVTRPMVEGMAAGSVIVDLAVETGGNCELTDAAREVRHAGVRVVGLADAASRVAEHASRVFSRNVGALLGLLAPDGELAPDWDDEVVAGTVVTRGGAVVNERVKGRLAEAGQAGSADRPPAS